MFDRTHIRFIGDNAVCAQWLPFGRSLLRRLLATGLPVVHDTIQVLDGTRITAKVVLNERFVIIQAGQGCPAYLSGLVDIHYLISQQPENQQQKNALHRWQPSPAVAAKLKYQQDWRIAQGKYPATLGDLEYRDPPSIVFSPPEGWTVSGINQTYNIKPTLYSGKMRSVVQYIIGTTQQVRYDFRFNRTHGVFVQTIEVQGQPTRTVDWLVEINKDQGVLAMLLPVCTAKLTADNVLNYVPLGASFPTGDKLTAALASGLVRMLAPASELSAFYAKTAFFPECGWAFSYSGHEAQNTAWDWPGTYKFAYQYKIAISADENGAPLSAAMSLVDSGRMVGNQNPAAQTAKGQIQFPSYLLDCSITFDMRPAGAYANPLGSNCPLYVYYDGETPQVVRWRNDSGAVTDTYPPFYATYRDFQQYLNYEENYGITRLFCNSTTNSTTGTSIYDHSLQTPQKAHVVDLSIGGTRNVFEMTATRNPEPEWLKVEGSGAYGASSHLWTPAWLEVNHYSLTQGGVSRVTTDSCVIPLYDREGQYHYRRSVQTSVVNRSVTNWSLTDNVGLLFTGIHSAITVGLQAIGYKLESIEGDPFDNYVRFGQRWFSEEKAVYEAYLMDSSIYRDFMVSEYYDYDTNQLILHYMGALNKKYTEIGFFNRTTVAASALFGGSADHTVTLPLTPAMEGTGTNDWILTSNGSTFSNRMSVSRDHEAIGWYMSHAPNQNNTGEAATANIAGYTLSGMTPGVVFVGSAFTRTQ
jgi:hypothetical protein